MIGKAQSGRERFQAEHRGGSMACATPGTPRMPRHSRWGLESFPVFAPARTPTTRSCTCLQQSSLGMCSPEPGLREEAGNGGCMGGRQPYPETPAAIKSSCPHLQTK